ncbi:MAG: CcoQ/FixQ family Cbb3-type cytochrome c oxidase assembly chaperone [Ignavibacteriales bacterium]|nr:CcoQ/FixQ family Cbb3-type cytochrome c oxidase assembly chaperone [Ignavibacteriales bacterium]
MFQNLLSNIKDVTIYPIVSLAIFMIFFSGVLIWAFNMKKEYISEMENLPLVKDDENLNKGNSDE